MRMAVVAEVVVAQIAENNVAAVAGAVENRVVALATEQRVVRSRSTLRLSLPRMPWISVLPSAPLLPTLSLL